MRDFFDRNFIVLCVVAALAGALVSLKDGPIAIAAGAFSGLEIAAAAAVVSLGRGRKLISLSRGGERVFDIVPGFELKLVFLGVGFIGPILTGLQMLHVI